MKAIWRMVTIVAVAWPLSAAAVTSIDLDFGGSGNTLEATGFDAVYNLEPSGFNVADGMLSIDTLPSDTFGQFENDPDNAINMFYSEIDPLQMTTVEARVKLTGLNANFHGGGIWMGTDTDHYVRLGIAHNSFEGPIVVESLRENEDRWVNADPPGQGDDIVSARVGLGGASPQVDPVELILRIVRDGNTAVASFSDDDGATFTQVGPVYEGVALPGDPQGQGSNTIEEPVSFKVGVWAFGGPPEADAATAMFDSFSAVSVPEPASAALVVAGLAAAARRRRP